MSILLHTQDNLNAPGNPTIIHTLWEDLSLFWQRGCLGSTEGLFTDNYFHAS